jgi:hypothetical protein
LTNSCLFKNYDSLINQFITQKNKNKGNKNIHVCDTDEYNDA